MYAERRSGLLSRPGPLIAVISVHVIIAYLLSISMGVMSIPKILESTQVVFIPEAQEVIPEPEIPVVTPEITQQQVIDNPMPEIEIPPDVVAVPAEVPSDTALVATEPAGQSAQELKTRTRTDPIYPPASRRAGEEGMVRLRILVDERGMPREVQIAKGSGFARLDQAAIDAVRKWRFVAATNGSQSVAAWTQVAVTFRLTSQPG